MSRQRCQCEGCPFLSLPGCSSLWKGGLPRTGRRGAHPSSASPLVYHQTGIATFLPVSFGLFGFVWFFFPPNQKEFLLSSTVSFIIFISSGQESTLPISYSYRVEPDTNWCPSVLDTDLHFYKAQDGLCCPPVHFRNPSPAPPAADAHVTVRARGFWEHSPHRIPKSRPLTGTFMSGTRDHQMI